MIAALCLDDNNGISFGNRRQSRDSAVCKDLSELSKGNKLYIKEYSAGIFENSGVDFGNINVVASFEELVKNCGAGAYDCAFIENELPDALLGSASEIIVYRWNRDYPFDLCVPSDFPGVGWSFKSETDIAGSSHDKITKQIYVRAV